MATAIIGIVIVIAVAAAVRYIVRTQKAGGCVGCPDCSNGHCDHCAKEQTK